MWGEISTTHPRTWKENWDSDKLFKTLEVTWGEYIYKINKGKSRIQRKKTPTRRKMNKKKYGGISQNPEIFEPWPERKKVLKIWRTQERISINSMKHKVSQKIHRKEIASVKIKILE